jgi:hypothetical protein
MAQLNKDKEARLKSLHNWFGMGRPIDIEGCRAKIFVRWGKAHITAWVTANDAGLWTMLETALLQDKGFRKHVASIEAAKVAKKIEPQGKGIQQ